MKQKAERLPLHASRDNFVDEGAGVIVTVTRKDLHGVTTIIENPAREFVLEALMATRE
jgi:hypothetical protein